MLLILEKNGDQTLVPVDLQAVKEAVGVEEKRYCDESECFQSQLAEADAILYLDSFEMPFEQVEKLAESRWNRPQVIRIRENDGVYQVEYHGVPSPDVTAKEVPNAIGNLIYIQDRELIERRRLFHCVALVVILITLFLHLHVAPGVASQSSGGGNMAIGSQVEDGQ